MTNLTISIPITISSEIQEIMQNQREALGRLAEKLAGEAKRDVQKSLDQLEVRIKSVYKHLGSISLTYLSAAFTHVVPKSVRVNQVISIFLRFWDLHV